MGAQNELLVGVAQLLDMGGVGTYSTSTAYQASDVGIVLGAVPSDPASVIVLNTYPVSDDFSLSDSVIGLQVITRAAGPSMSAVNDLSDAVFDQLHGLSATTVGTVAVTSIERRSGTPLGMDDLQRQSRSDNYYVTLWRPSPHRN